MVEEMAVVSCEVFDLVCLALSVGVLALLLGNFELAEGRSTVAHT